MIVVVGESLVDIVDRQDGQEPDEQVGGGPLNIAVGLARLDQPALLITQTARDARGERIQQRLHDNEVEVVVAPTASGRTSTATALVDASGAASYDFDLEWTLPHQELPDCDALHVGSLGTALDPGRTSVLDLVEQAYGRGTFLSFDPNLRPAFTDSAEAAWRDVESIADRATLVKMSDEDVALMQPGADPADIARILLQGERTELVVVTHGAGGAVGYAEGIEVGVPTPQVDVADTVGAGDSFMSALLAILADDGALSTYGGGLPADEAGLHRLLTGAATAAAVTCSRRGADPPRRSELPDGWPAEQ
ncbi:carbohydrate kinase [Nocardioides mangrovicus]|uniref:Carbohydrate kinase n=1 Tax=Nocardioides mangrovicus TaxID=2478913 RepID=A0A3L8P6A0_9ACTN|nr:carbohydrate kinase [Nocardioides mangrovicus]RLV50785.1 carbohydrate kinase [Nocardioides mangrovicus]